MQKTMLEIRVTTHDGKIIIEGPEDHQHEISTSIEVHPDQVDMLIGWIQEAKKEISEEKK